MYKQRSMTHSTLFCIDKERNDHGGLQISRNNVAGKSEKSTFQAVKVRIDGAVKIAGMQSYIYKASE